MKSGLKSVQGQRTSIEIGATCPMNKRIKVWLWIAVMLVSRSGCIDLVTDGGKNAVTNTSVAILESFLAAIIDGVTGNGLVRLTALFPKRVNDAAKTGRQMTPEQMAYLCMAHRKTWF